jgi:uncharacterized heparinase superfamily protein
MSRIRMIWGLIARLPTVMRTLAHLRPAQVRAQIHHGLFGLGAPRKASGEASTLAIPQPQTPFLEPPAHVKSVGGTRIELLGVPFSLSDGIEWETKARGPLFAYHLHQHEYLRLPEFTPADRAKVLLDWIHNSPAGIGWDPHPISLRLFCWGKLLTTPGALEADPRLRNEMLSSMADQLETLAHGLEVRLQANHLLSNLVSVVFGGVLLDGTASAGWRDQTDALLRELDAQIGPDGGHQERSPMYHSLLLENLLDLLNFCLAEPARAPSKLINGLRETTSRMLGALDLWTHLDGRIALFADSAFDVAAEPGSLREYAGRLGVTRPVDSGSGVLSQTGYLRLRAGAFDLIASVAGPLPAHQPGHAHCDALAFELSIAGERFVTDAGLFEYLPGPRRDRARATASHSTLRIDGQEQAEIWAAHRIGGRPEVELTAWDESGSAEATCRGWSRNAALHRRFFSVTSEGVSIVDRVEGPSHEVRVCLPIDPAWRVELVGGHARATRELEGGVASIVEVELADVFEWGLERQPYYPTFGCEIERFALVGAGARCGEAVTRIRCVD